MEEAGSLGTPLGLAQRKRASPRGEAGTSERRGILWRWRGPSGFRWVWRNGRGPHDSLRPHESQHARPPCPSPTPGVHQSCILSPCLFNLYAEYIMRNAGLEEAQAGIKIAGRSINNLRYPIKNTFKKKFSLATRGEDWASQGQPKGKAEIPVVTRECRRHKSCVICISEVIDTSPGNLDSSLCFLQLSVSHDVLCIYRRNSRKTTWFPPLGKMRPLPATASQGKSPVPP